MKDLLIAGLVTVAITAVLVETVGFITTVIWL